MSNDDKSGINPTLPPPYLHSVQYRQQEAISLVALWQILLKQKKIILFSLLVSTLIGIGVAVLKPAVYSFSTMVQIGTISSDNKRELIELPDTVLSKLVSAYIPFVLTEFHNKASYQGQSFAVNVSIPKKSELLLIEGKGPKTQEAAYKELIDMIVGKLVADHARIVNLKIKGLEVAIAHAENVLAGSKDGAKLITSNIKRLDKTAELLRSQIAEKKQLLTNALKNRERVSTNSATGAMSVLLIDNETQRYQQFISQLEKQLFIDLNQQHSEFEKALSDNVREQKDQQNNINNLKNTLANIRSTSAIVPILTSMGPVGIAKKMIVYGAILLGAILGVVLAFIYDFYQKQFANLKVAQ